MVMAADPSGWIEGPIPDQVELPPATEPEATGADDYLPRSSSSAMPDPNAASVPRLKARVHRRFSTADVCATLSLSEVRFRPLQASDLEEMMTLHTEWFPVSYDQAFYDKSVNGQLFSLVATHSAASQSGGSSSSAAVVHEAEEPEESLLGMITMSTFCEHHGEDIKHILGGECEDLCKRKRSSGPVSDAEEGQAVQSTGNTGQLAYILTLGVCDAFRRRGLAKELIRRSIAHVDQNMPEVLAVYLHVVTYNQAAIRLYESTSFTCIEHFPSFYFLHGSHYDSFLYALYLHGGHPPWKWRFRNLWSLGRPTTWREWLVTAWSSLWQSDADKRVQDSDP
mmetsp:Transcript_68445/g.110317  ORF Transcript_68445/g.110317 Transcript_68445/m.110317 type:complete len:338 (+) Transcript_68445:62-1075(+)